MVRHGVKDSTCLILLDTTMIEGTIIVILISQILTENVKSEELQIETGETNIQERQWKKNMQRKLRSSSQRERRDTNRELSLKSKTDFQGG